MSGCAGDLDDDVGVTVDALGDRDAVVTEDAAYDELTDAHADCSVDEEWAATGLIDEEEYD